MAAFIPSRRDEAVNRNAIARVRDDKQREARQGFDGTWVAHPDLVAVARDAFASVASDGSARTLGQSADDVAALLDVRVPGGAVTAAGVANNTRVAIEYLAAWLAGLGAVGIDNLMEDTATAEIARAQLWQWRRHRTPIDGGGPLTRQGYETVRDEALAMLRARGGAAGSEHWTDAASLLDELVLNETFADFLTVAGARYLAGP